MCKTSEIKIGDFIEIPAWRIIGCVFDKSTAYIGGESAVNIELQEDPESEETRSFRVEDGEFKWA